MKQYRAMTKLARANWMDDERVNVPSVTVFEPDGDWRETGLYDSAGIPLMSRSTIDPVGFVRFGAPEKDGA